MSAEKFSMHRRLIEYAWKGRRSAYSHYSGIAVGAALLCGNEVIYQGANVENSSYSLTVCAERAALLKAFLEGERQYIALAIAADTRSPLLPCGACLQVIHELAGNILVISANLKGQKLEHNLSELYPHPFSFENARRKELTGQKK